MNLSDYLPTLKIAMYFDDMVVVDAHPKNKIRTLIKHYPGKFSLNKHEIYFENDYYIEWGSLFPSQFKK